MLVLADSLSPQNFKQVYATKIDVLFALFHKCVRRFPCSCRHQNVLRRRIGGCADLEAVFAAVKVMIIIVEDELDSRLPAALPSRCGAGGPRAQLSLWRTQQPILQATTPRDIDGDGCPETAV
jgi:hypothetical protein